MKLKWHQLINYYIIKLSIPINFPEFVNGAYIPSFFKYSIAVIPLHEADFFS